MFLEGAPSHRKILSISERERERSSSIVVLVTAF
jgi:hypothetical protein